MFFTLVVLSLILPDLSTLQVKKSLEMKATCNYRSYHILDTSVISSLPCRVYRNEYTNWSLRASPVRLQSSVLELDCYRKHR